MRIGQNANFQLRNGENFNENISIRHPTDPRLTICQWTVENVQVHGSLQSGAPRSAPKPSLFVFQVYIGQCVFLLQQTVTLF